jgi:hypothetical protein
VRIIPKEMDGWDALSVLGVVCVVGGIGLIHVPSALIFLGIVMVAAGVVLPKRS